MWLWWVVYLNSSCSVFVRILWMLWRYHLCFSSDLTSCRLRWPVCLCGTNSFSACCYWFWEKRFKSHKCHFNCPLETSSRWKGKIRVWRRRHFLHLWGGHIFTADRDAKAAEEGSNTVKCPFLSAIHCTDKKKGRKQCPTNEQCCVSFPPCMPFSAFWAFVFRHASTERSICGLSRSPQLCVDSQRSERAGADPVLQAGL